MPLDKEIENAIHEVASEMGQPDAIARRLIAWLEDESNREVSHVDQVDHLKNLRDAIQTNEI
ncbi:MAG: CxC ATPase DNA modification system associated small protein [Candidatus Thiodiazotropha sp.]